MGDVHGIKPIFRSLVFDCLRWAELIVCSLVERPDAPPEAIATVTTPPLYVAILGF